MSALDLAIRGSALVLPEGPRRADLEVGAWADLALVVRTVPRGNTVWAGGRAVSPAAGPLVTPQTTGGAG